MAGEGRPGHQHAVHDASRREGQPLEASIAVDLQYTTEVLEMSGRTLCLAIRTVEVDGGRRFGPGPGSIVARIDPQSAGFGAAAGRTDRGRDPTKQSVREMDAYLFADQIP